MIQSSILLIELPDPVLLSDCQHHWVISEDLFQDGDYVILYLHKLLYVKTWADLLIKGINSE